MDTIAQQKKDQLCVHIRLMIRRDCPEILQIEQKSFGYARTEEDFLHYLQQRNCIGLVTEYGEKIVGFMIYELFKDRFEIINFAVHPEYRRSGAGTQLVKKLIGKLRINRRTIINLLLRETNVGAQLFFREQCFRATSVNRSYYENTGEDAFSMEYRLDGFSINTPDEAQKG